MRLVKYPNTQQRNTLKNLLKHIEGAKSIILSTHRQCDGDGLGAELGVYHALKKSGKRVQIINVDHTPKKYHYLNPDKHIQYFENSPKMDVKADLALIFDTNDERLVAPLFSKLQEQCSVIAFVDHHPILKQGPQPTQASYIDENAASTGEIAFNLIQALGIEMDAEIASALYTSIAFDTQLFRFVRNSPRSHEIAAILLKQPIKATDIHRCLFGNQTVNKMAFLAKALAQIEYYSEGRFALVKLKDQDLFHYNLDPDDSRDVIDMLMNIEILEAAALFREDNHNTYKLSLRSKGKIEVLQVAEFLGGGGHLYAAGAFLKGNYEEFKTKVVRKMTALLEKVPNAKKEKS